MQSKKSILVTCLLLFYVLTSFEPNTYYPPPSSIDFENYMLTIYPPDPLPAPPVQLISYNVFINDEFYSNVQVNVPEDSICCPIDSSLVNLGENTFCVKSVYNEWISDPTCVTDTVYSGNPLPFFEDWSSGNFETNGWTVDGEHWTIGNEGYHPPSLIFYGEDINNSFDETVISRVFLLDTIPFLHNYLTFDCAGDYYGGPNNVNLNVEEWNWEDNSWKQAGQVLIHEIWRAEKIWLPKTDRIFAFRFRISGPVIGYVDYVAIDNIKLERDCYPITTLSMDILDPYYRILQWSPPILPRPDWIYWCENVFSGTSIGTGNQVEFDVAARWEPQQLRLDFNQPFTIDQVAFVPCESLAEYNVRIWVGSDAANLIIDMPVDNLEMGDWNVISLVNPVTINPQEELWVGYHVNTTTGYPAGVDDGPAIDGYGNMMNLGGWQTLVQINPDLDYNWNIKFHVPPCLECLHIKYFNIYRSPWNDDFQLIDTTWNMYRYIDSTTIAGELYIYKVGTVYYSETDTCESISDYVSDWFPHVESNESDQEMSIYPVPAASILKISSSRIIDKVEVFNTIGNNVFTSYPEKEEIDIPLDTFPNGLYIISIYSGTKIVRKKALVFK